MDRTTRIIHWNANGLRRKVVPLRTLLQDQDVDIALISETLLGPADRCNIPGYHVYREDEKSDAGKTYRGLLILIRRRIVHQRLPAQKLQSMYAMGVEVAINGHPIRLYAGYRPPGGTLLEEKDLSTIMDDPLPTLLAGDLNSQHIGWNSITSNRHGNHLLRIAEKRGYTVQGPETPTHYPFNDNHAPDVLDVIVYRGLSEIPYQEVLLDNIQSDHQPVLVTLQLKATTRLSGPRTITNWDTFGKELLETTPTRPVSTPADVNLLAEDLQKAMMEALQKAKRTITTQCSFPLPPRTKRKIEAKKLWRKRWQETRCPAIKTLVNKLAEEIRGELNEAYEDKWLNKLEEAADDWSAMHKLCRQLSNKPNPTRPLLHEDGDLRYRAEDRAEIFAQHLERQFQPNPAGDHQHAELIKERVEDFLATSIPQDEEHIIFSPGTVSKTIRKLKLRKAPGYDGVNNLALRYLPFKTVAAVTRLFNGILRTGEFPTCWKKGQVIMLPKPGKNTTKPESYRPITLLTSTSKLFEKLVLSHLIPHIPPRPEQHGFRSGHSTTHQLVRVTHMLAEAKNTKKKAVMALLDMEKAFDRVWHDGLTYKLITSPAPRRVVKIIDSFLRGRECQVKVEGKTSSSRPVRAGVPQGSCLSPILYTRFTDDIPVGEGVELALYADDAAYISISMNAEYAALKMQRNLDLLPDWLSKWRLKVNVSKTQALKTTRGNARAVTKLKLYDKEIPWSPTVKYLGVTLDSNLNMKPHVGNVIAAARATRSQLKPILTANSISVKIKLGIYKAYIRPRLTYAAPAWYALLTNEAQKKIESQQNLTARQLVNAPRYVRNTTILRDLKLETLDAFIRRLATGLFKKADRSAWSHIRDLAPCHGRPPDVVRKRKGCPRDLVVATTSDDENKED